VVDERASDTLRLNTPVQRTAADGLKRALAILWERRQECPAAAPVLAAHDEIVVERPAGDAAAAADCLTRAMVDGMAPFVRPSRPGSWTLLRHHPQSK
jgi:DNA polymerase I-like protein with 3'-5' exonuclease and polymerase domains